MLYVLPFKSFRLSVIDSRGGLAIFTHSWKSTEEIIGDVLFSGMIQGINLIVKESVGQGEVRELMVDNGVFIFQRSAEHHLIFVLVASKSSRILRDSLIRFSDEFIQDYSPCLNNTTNIMQFSGASDMVNKYFPYIA